MGRGGERDGGGTYQVAYQNVGHLMSTWWTESVSGLPSFTSAWGGKAHGVLVRRRAASRALEQIYLWQMWLLGIRAPGVVEMYCKRVGI